MSYRKIHPAAIFALAVVLTCNGAPAPAQTVTGSGATNTVPVFTGTSTVGNSPISVSNGNVGIGTTSPQTTLDVNGTLSDLAELQTMGFTNLAPAAAVSTTGGTISGGGPTGTGFNDYWRALATGQQLTIDLGAPYGLAWMTFGTYFRGDGRFIPASYAVDGSPDNSTWTNLATVTGNNSLAPRIAINAAYRYLRLTVNAFQSGQSFVDIAGVQILTNYGSAMAGSLAWGINPSNNAVFLNTAGAVGIGTTNPAYTLDVAGQIHTSNGLVFPDGSVQTTAYNQIASGSNVITQVNGNVGIGVANPTQAFEIGGAAGALITAWMNDGAADAVTGLEIQSPTSSNNGKNEQFEWFVNEDSVHVPARSLSLYQFPSDNLGGCCHEHAAFGITSTGANYQYFSGNVGIGTTSPGATLEVNGTVKLTANSGASITFPDSTVQSTAWTGALVGGDYAESVGISGNRTEYEPGDLLVVDKHDPSKFAKSSEPYSTMVAGIYSTKPGAVGRRQTTPKSADEIPMAVVGIVPARVSAENGAIEAGDLLVSSSTPGVSMKGTDRNRMLGAVVGKAMGTLNSGTGVIEVLVTLQ